MTQPTPNVPAPSRPTQVPARPKPLLKAMLADKHFLIASAILAVTAGGWGAATRWLQLTTLKTPVPWPAALAVGEDFRLLSVTGGKGLEEFGPFKRLLPNDELSKVDANFSNWEIIKPTDLETLRIGTAVDEERYASRRSNWYMVRRYVDRRPHAPVRSWRLEIYYCTGEADTVAHIPDTCGTAGGGDVLESNTVSWTIPETPQPWAKVVPWHRTLFRWKSGVQTLVYYTFSMNGEFSDSRIWVRWELLNPFRRYGYFAKVQFSPEVFVTQSAETDRAAEEFMRSALPEALRALPSSQDVKLLEQSR